MAVATYRMEWNGQLPAGGAQLPNRYVSMTTPLRFEVDFNTFLRPQMVLKPAHYAALHFTAMYTEMMGKIV